MRTPPEENKRFSGKQTPPDAQDGAARGILKLNNMKGNPKGSAQNVSLIPIIDLFIDP